MDTLTGRVTRTLLNLGALSPAGYAIALDIQFTTPSYLFQTYPQAWLAEYAARGYVLKDPTVAWGIRETGHRRWSELSGAGSQVVFEAAASHGMAFGVTIAFERNDRHSVSSFARADREFSDAEIAQLSDGLDLLHALLSGPEQPDMDEIRSIKAISVALSHTQ